MSDKRHTRPSLYGTRIYVRRGWFQYFAPTPIPHAKTGELKKWHKLAPLEEGETKARLALDSLLNRVKPASGNGDFPIFFRQWRTHMQKLRDLKAPHDPVRLKIWQDGTRSLDAVYGVIEHAFAEMNVADIEPSDVADFLDQWQGRRSAQSYRGHLSKFFEWTCSRCKPRLRTTNPATADVVSVEAPPKRDVLITPEQYHKIRDALMTVNDTTATRNGAMIQCYLDLTYLLYQRTTDIRLLRRDQIDNEAGVIYFKPTKTEKSSGGKVAIPISPAIRQVLKRLEKIATPGCMYVIHNEDRQPYTASGLRSAFDRARKRAGVSGITMKDIRAMAATDARNAGYTPEQLQVALVHTDLATTRGYLRTHATPSSQVVLSLPTRPTTQKN